MTTGKGKTSQMENALETCRVRATIALKPPPLRKLKSGILPEGHEFDDDITRLGILPKDSVLKPSTISYQSPDPGDMRAPLGLPEYVKFKGLIPIFTGERTYKLEAKIALYWYSTLLDGVNLGSDQKYIEFYVGLCLNVLDPGSLNAINSVLEKTSYTYEMIETSEEFIDHWMRTQPKLTTYIEMITKLPEDAGFGFAGILYSLCFTLMGKFINDKTSESYFYNRYRAFASACICSDLAAKMIDAQLTPDRKSCGAAYSSISGAHGLRKLIFQKLVTASKTGDYIFADTFKIVISYLANTEMMHIYLINRYILEDYPELLSMQCLRSLQNRLADALEYISKVPYDERPYIKILRNKEETYVLNRSHFDLLTAAARVVGAYSSPSYRNYQGATEGALGVVRSAVEEYLQLCSQKSGVRSIIQSKHAAISDYEKELLLEEINNESQPGSYELSDVRV